MKDNNSILLETISHVTSSRPFSFHHTITPSGAELVLYLHWHTEVEFLFIEKGEAIFCIEDMEYHLKEGDAIFVPPSLLHMAKSLDGKSCEFYAVVFSTPFLINPNINPHYADYLAPVIYYSLRCPLHLTAAVSWQNDILVHLNSIFSFNHENIEQWELSMHGRLLIIWQLLFNNHLSKIKASVNMTKLATHLDKAINHIHYSYSNEITLRQLAELSHLSEGQFCRLFKQMTGFTPFSYINRYRILKSCEYLTLTSKQVTEVATLCGFNNISYYNREFMKYIKITPSSYRKESFKT